jgi:hypothetical protein
MKVEQLVRKFGFGKNVFLYSAPRAHEEWINVVGESLHCARNCETGIEVTACPAARKQDAHLCAA